MEPQEEEGSSLPALRHCGLEGERPKGGEVCVLGKALGRGGGQSKQRQEGRTAEEEEVSSPWFGFLPSPLCPAHSSKDKDLLLSTVTAHSPSIFLNASFRKPSLVSVAPSPGLHPMEMPHSQG